MMDDAVVSSEASSEDLIAFALTHPWWPHWPEAQLRAFLGRLISGPRQVIEIREQGQRVALAVLLDQVRNPGGQACLELLGLAPGADPDTCFGRILAEARALLRPGQGGIQIGPAPQGPDAATLRAHGCAPYYEMYEMICPQPGSLAAHRLVPAARLLDRSGFEAYYALLSEAFAANPETSISDYDTGLAAFEAEQADGRSRIWLLDGPERPLAFVNLLCQDPGGDIRILGVAPEARGQGHGRALLGHALAWLGDQGLAPCRLSVMVRNAHALDLYRSMGFNVTGQSACWLWQPDPRELTASVS